MTIDYCPHGVRIKIGDEVDCLPCKDMRIHNLNRLIKRLMDDNEELRRALNDARTDNEQYEKANTLLNEALVRREREIADKVRLIADIQAEVLK